ncbi:MAG: hypothetical protein NC409_13305 [Clostridium sp.]|nr:hypothetical protein [Clostridium sp.]
MAYWKCQKCSKLFSDAAGTRETSADAVKLPATGHKFVLDHDDIYMCSACKKQFKITPLSDGTTVVQSLEESIALPLQPAPEEEQEEPAPQNAEEPDDRNEDGQNAEEAQGKSDDQEQGEPGNQSVEEAQEEPGKSDEQGEEAGQEQGGQDAQNPSEEQQESNDGITDAGIDAERYGLLYPEGEEPESDPAEGSWEENAVSLRAAAPESGMEQTAGEQQGYSLQISIAVLAVLAGAVLFFGLRKKNTI